MYKVICFDLDGTLLDSIADIAKSMNMVLQHHSLESRSIEDYKKFIGNGSKELVKRAACLDSIDEMHEQYTNLYNINATKATKEYTDVSKTLLHLKNKYKLVVVTNKPDKLAKKIVTHYFKDIFDLVVGQKEGIAAKPNPQMMDEVLKHYKLKTTNKILFVGDSEVDYQFALNCKMDHYIVTYGYSNLAFLSTLDNSIKLNTIKDLLNKLQK